MPKVDDWRSPFYIDRMRAAMAINRDDPTRTFDSVVKEIFGPYTIKLLVEKDERLENTWLLTIDGDCHILGDNPDRVAGLIGMCNENIKARKIVFDTVERKFVYLCTST